MSDDEKSQTGGDAGGEESAKKASQPEDFKIDMGDMDAARKRRERQLAEAKKKREAEGGGDDDDGDIKVTKIGSLFDDDPIPIAQPSRKTKSSGGAPGRPGGLERTSTDPMAAEQDAAMMAQQEMNAALVRERERNTIKVGEKTLTKWPWDHYHEVQQEFWELHFERMEQARLKRQQAEEGDSDGSSDVSISSSEEEEEEDLEDDDDSSSDESSSSSDSSGSETSEERLQRKLAARRARRREQRREKRRAEKKRIKRMNRDTHIEQEKRRKMRQKAMEQERQSGLHELKSDILVFKRPKDPPELQDAVAGLPLTEFESVAKERSIAILSTWLFDAGLVQELMQTKKVQDKDNADAEEEKKKEKKVQIKILPLGGDKNKKNQEKKVTGPKRTKMDIEIEKLEKMIREQLNVINDRLNKGVTTSGNEVQELVNSVVNTKSELVKLREQSSMISNVSDNADGVAGVAATQTSFAINKYPHLKYAINARRNLQKCFRELTFFSQIPESCAQLTDELNSSEWTETEWTTLRKVCKEHVQLEIFLVEAESGMRKQADDGEDDEEKKSRRRSSVGGGFGVGLAHNNDEVDRFLKEHVQNVWELGDEIRMKILSGIATSFDLAFNNPAGMVALVEAVEIYETANREYQAVHGDDANKDASKSLRFTDMRAVALGELYKDMEAR